MVDPTAKGRPGKRTSEFWTVAALAILMVLNQSLDLGLDESTLQNLAIAVAGYAVSRGLAKKG